MPMTTILDELKHWGAMRLRAVSNQLQRWSRPLTHALVGGAMADVAKSKSALLAENALLRQQLIIVRRQVKRPTRTPGDRARLVFLARRTRAWQSALLIVQSQALLRWHCHGYRLFWRAHSASARKRPQIAPETVAFARPGTPVASTPSRNA